MGSPNDGFLQGKHLVRNGFFSYYACSSGGHIETKTLESYMELL